MSSTIKPLPGFSHVYDAYHASNDTLHSVVGFITDSMQPSLTKKGQWMFTISVCDYDLVNRQGHWHPGAKVRFFRQEKDDLPRAKNGDLILLRDIKKIEFSSSPILVSSNGWSSSWALCDPKLIPSPQFSERYLAGKAQLECTYMPRDRPLTVTEQLFVIQLKDALWDRFQKEVVSKEVERVAAQRATRLEATDTNRPPFVPADVRNNPPTGPRHTTNQSRPLERLDSWANNQKYSLIQDVIPDKFYDFNVEVVKIFSPPFGDFVEVYVTDYTTNVGLFNYETPEEKQQHGGYSYSYNEKPWPGPFGQMTLKIEVHYPHAKKVLTDIKERDLIQVTNCRVKLSRRDHSLESNIFRDKLHPDRIYIAKLESKSSHRTEELIARKKSYWAGRQETNLAFPNMSKKKRKRAEEQAAAEKKRATVNNEVDHVITNKYVKSGNVEVPTSTITSMLSLKGKYRSSDGTDKDLPFINQRLRCQVRVIDYYPSSLTNFTSAPNITGKDFTTADDDDDDETSMDLDSSREIYQWDFFLLIEDATKSKTGNGLETKHQAWIHISHNSAEFLLRLNATDLNKDSLTLNQLHQKMDILCGNLTELKSEGMKYHDTAGRYDDSGNYWQDRLSNLPFHCCIQEYGQPLDDIDISNSAETDQWIRLFEMFETTIL